MKPIFQRKIHPVVWILLVLLLLVGYGYRQSSQFIKGPTIVIDQPVNGDLFEEPFITISGQALRIAKLYLNDNQIFTDDDGRFSESLLLLPGYNILTLKAEDGFQRQTVQILELILEENSA